jgi:hypothetical protein
MLGRINKLTIFGALWLLVMSILIYSQINPIKELALGVAAQTTDGFVTNTFSDVYDDEDCRGCELFNADYEYRTPDGRKFTGTFNGNFTNLFSAETPKPIPIKVEYLSAFPSVSRIKGSGSNGARSLTVTVAVQVVGSVVLLIPGLGMLWAGCRRHSHE